MYETAPTISFQINCILFTHFCFRVLNRRLATFIEPETQTVTFSDFCADCNGFFFDANSAISKSVVAGLLSFSLAQLSLYSIRHEGEMNLRGKIVYFLACLMNSISVMITMTTYCCLAMATLFPIIMITIKLANGMPMHCGQRCPTPVYADPKLVSILIIIAVIAPIQFLPQWFSHYLNSFVQNHLMSPHPDANDLQRGGYDLFSFASNFFWFLPVPMNKYENFESLPTIDQKYHYFSNNPLSRHLFRHRFKINLICRIVIQNFYILLSLIFLHTSHFFLDLGLAEFPFHLQITTYPEFKILLQVCAIASYTSLFLSFMLLKIYYDWCHPWKSEGLSFGYEPNDAWSKRRSPIVMAEGNEKIMTGQWHSS